MTGLLRTSKLWAYGAIVLAIALVSLCGYAYYRHSRMNALIEDLQSGGPEVAQAAARALGEMGPDIISYLLPKIKEMNSQSRTYTAAALRHVETAVPSLVETLRDKDATMRAATAEILGHIGPAAKDAVPALIVALNDEDEEVRDRVKLALGEIKDTRAIEPLLATFRQQRKRGDAEDAAEESLIRIGPAAIPALIKALENDAPEVKESAARVLGKMGSDAKEAVPVLISLINDEDENLSRTVIMALGEIKDARAIKPLIDTFYRNPSSENVAPIALGKIGSEAIPPLVEKLKEEKAIVRNFSASALGEIGPAAKVAVPSLIAMLKDPDVRTQAIRALGKIKDKEALQPLLALLKQKPLPEGVIEALGEIGPDAKAAVPLLESMVWEDNHHAAAITAWKKISPESMNDIIYNEQMYAHLEDAVSSIQLLPPMKGAIILGVDGSPKAINFTFEWRRVNQKSGVSFCSVVILDKGENPFDDGRRLSLTAGANTELHKELDYSQYYSSDFEWGVKVIACRDNRTGCDKNGSCVGRIFKSDIGMYSAED